MYGAQLRTCCRIGGWNHHSGHRAMIVCDNCTQRSAIVFLTPGQLAGHMHTPRIHFMEHMHTEKTRFQHQIWTQKWGQFPDLQFVPLPFGGWFLGPPLGLRNGPRNAAFFPPFALSFGAQYLVRHGRSCNDSLCARPASPPKGLLAQSFLAQS